MKVFLKIYYFHKNYHHKTSWNKKIIEKKKYFKKHDLIWGKGQVEKHCKIIAENDVYESCDCVISVNFGPVSAFRYTENSIIMRWFEGTITAAITEAKQRRVLFVVYIHGEQFQINDTNTQKSKSCSNQQLDWLASLYK